MKRPLARIIAVGAASAVAAVATLVCTAPAFAATKNGNYYFSYGAAYQRIDSLGAEATFSIPQPTVVAPKAGQAQMHSLAEIAVQQLENNRAKNTVEVGWMVGYPGKNDNKPHLFVFRWINGVGDPACYGGCGFVSLASAVAKPGDTIPVGTSINLAIVHRSAAEAGTLGKAGWWIVYGDHWIGYYPDSVWNGAFISANYNNWFGEVSHNTEQPQCSEMGNGLKASDESAASITNISNVFAGYSPRPASITVHEPTDPKYYTVTKVSDTSMRYGGVGVC